MAEDSGVVARREGRAGTILMDRPRALNALTAAMIAAMAGAAREFAADPSVELVVLEGAGGRAFCAGGDVRAIREAVLARDHAPVEAFFAAEYALNRAIAESPKPWVSLVDGVCLGGGIGVSGHGSHRVVTERAALAMPETAIGLFPDVGTSHLLPRLPGETEGAVGNWLALTGARLSGGEAVAAGLATHFVPSSRLAALRAALVAEGVGAVERHAEPADPGAVGERAGEIGRLFAAGTVPNILLALEADGGAWARSQAAVLRGRSPTSLVVTRELLRRGAALDLPACLSMELRLTRAMTRHPDFAEGVRAVLVDKDGAPRWRPARVEAVDEAAVRAMFEDQELEGNIII